MSRTNLQYFGLQLPARLVLESWARGMQGTDRILFILRLLTAGNSPKSFRLRVYNEHYLNKGPYIQPIVTLESPDVTDELKLRQFCERMARVLPHVYRGLTRRSDTLGMKTYILARRTNTCRCENHWIVQNMVGCDFNMKYKSDFHAATLSLAGPNDSGELNKNPWMQDDFGGVIGSDTGENLPDRI
ncbi:hypothetical protein BU16DRAFT_566868 [Lophium mytilinum]|uniref:Uncharacterized protein n=1 Tax=Lophium mytilinum TaxID=390894 RepID=A0A6A6QE67_9PEZI|nr:hypothetical protein BU16DRAFT_566868 [Lophium mytilinum]